jgi:hypothetical protein
MQRCALAAQTTRIIALTALTTLGLSGAPVHEPVHAEALLSGHPVTVRNTAESAFSTPTLYPLVDFASYSPDLDHAVTEVQARRP